MAATMRRPVRGEPTATAEAFCLAVLTALTEVGVEAGDEFTLAPANSDGPAPGSVEEDVVGGYTDATSREAAIDHYLRSGTLRGKVLRALAAAGDAGAISDVLAEHNGWRLYSVKPRLIELRRGGWAERTGAKRPSATGSKVDVYRITEKGREALRELDSD